MKNKYYKSCLIIFVLGVTCLATVAYAFSLTLSSSTIKVHKTSNLFIGAFDSTPSLDILVLNTDLDSLNDYDFYSNDGNGLFTLESTFGNSLNQRDGDVGDLDGDGDLDFVSVEGSATIKKYLNDSIGGFNSSTIATVLGISKIKLVDLDEDGDLDITFFNTSAGSNNVFLNDGKSNFSQLGSSVPGVTSVVFFDVDSDNISDFIASDNSANLSFYKNNGDASFTLTTSINTSSYFDLRSADLNGDGSIDVIATNDNGFYILTNDGTGNFTLAGGPYGSVDTAKAVSAGDIDNDGDIDVVLAATPLVPINGGNEIWINNGSGVFTQTGIPTEESDPTQAVVLGDIDSDGDLDYIAGNTGMPNRHYKSDQATTLANTAPSAPSTGFNVIKLSEPAAGYAKVRVMWGSGSDTQSTQRMLQYQLKMGTGSGLHNIVSGKAASPDYVSRIMPNGQSRNYVLTIPCDETYYWSVATRDPSLSLSGFSTEQSFILDGSCTLTVLGGGGGGGGSNGGSGGGGFSWHVFRQGHPWDAPRITEKEGWRTAIAMREPGVVQGSIFLDVNLDGARHAGEVGYGNNLAVTVTGKAWNGNAVDRNVVVDRTGAFAINLPASDAQGYKMYLTSTDNDAFRITTETGADDEEQMEQVPEEEIDAETVPGLLMRKGIIVLPKETMNLEVGIIWKDMIQSAPCLHIGPATMTSAATDSLTFLSRATDAYGQRVQFDTVLTEGLMTRRQFLRLLQRTQCVPLQRSVPSLEKALQQRIIGGNGRTLEELRLRDAPFGRLLGDSHIAYSLLAAGIPAGKKTMKGLAADFDAPMTRKEAVLMLAAAMGIHPDATGVTLPRDVNEMSDSAAAVRMLLALRVLPPTLEAVIGLERGLETREGAELLARAAFAAGRVSLMRSALSKKDDARMQGFLAAIPAFHGATCLTEDDERRTRVTFSDILPGDPQEEDVRHLVGLGIGNDQQRTLWLIPGTRRPTEFGVTQGRITLALDEPVSLMELLRTALVLSCQPPPSQTTVRSWNGTPPLVGTAGSRVSQDRLAGMPRNDSLLSRIFFASQDHAQEFDLSLLTYADAVLNSKEARDPFGPISAKDGSRILASATMGLAIRQGSITPQQAGIIAPDLAHRMLGELLGQPIDWRTDAIGNERAFTRGMLMRAAATIVTGRRSVDSQEGGLPAGIVWRERLMGRPQKTK